MKDPKLKIEKALGRRISSSSPSSVIVKPKVIESIGAEFVFAKQPMEIFSCTEKKVSFQFLIPFLKVYIVYFGEHKGDKTLHEIEETHLSYLLSVTEEEEARACLLYSYKHSINGFAAFLTPYEVSKLSELEEVVSVFESHPTEYSLQTTRSWKFLGLQDEDVYSSNQFSIAKETLKRAEYGKNVIVGIIDSGIWPESKSFSAEGMDSVPEFWKGKCQTENDFDSSHCNRKIIGAKYYLENFEKKYGSLNISEDSRSPRDVNGHGTHMASIVAGKSIEGATDIGGFAIGTASGGAPMAHLAIYKVCWTTPKKVKGNQQTCFPADILAAFDDAIANGVHVLSISMSGKTIKRYDEDTLAIGSLHAVKNDILVVSSAGNLGPTKETVTNVMPWVITVGASTIDRLFFRNLTLGNGVQIMGQTVTPHELENMHPLVHAKDVEDHDAKGQCLDGSLSHQKVNNKMVLCISGLGRMTGKCAEVKRAGGVGCILQNDETMGEEVEVDAHLLPATTLTHSDATKVLSYIDSTKNPMAEIGVAKTVLGIRPAPSITGFTGRGPSIIDPNILKPDIVAPGLNILGAWSDASAPTREPNDHRKTKYNIRTGSSIAVPHVAAVAALLKAIYPTWSSAAIKSALMTTASMRNDVGSFLTDYDGHHATPFAFGSGQLRPTKAMNPGLVYDASYKDYLIYLCSGGHEKMGAMSVLDPTFECPGTSIPLYDLNYPSLALPNINGPVIVQRTVTNVGKPYSTYVFHSEQLMGFDVAAIPDTLSFRGIGQKKMFIITVTPKDENREFPKGDYAFGWYTWTDKRNDFEVRSPMVVSLA
ncbi:subtilisin-like protease SBT5.6 [Tripterygium wilfordii]|uniref:subtilisin-like protease SBT5.6 n=1 Tax=Tripterygium wilfordii TaxID=458696 RepID=UPI0018F86473|nr:subtilisin-like protease SBT5.6 [Tripterygium wilfordii]